MVATTPLRRRRETNNPKYPKIQKEHGSAIDHAVRIIHAVCGLAGSSNLIENIRADLRADKVQTAIRHRDTAVVFDWLLAAVSYQGIADAVAYDYMERHGRAAWRDIDQKLGQGANSPAGPDRLTRMRDSLLEAKREIYGVSDKVLAMALSALLLAPPKKMVLWTEV